MFTYLPKYPNCEACQMRKTTRATCKTGPLKRAGGISPPTSLGALFTADHKIFNLDSGSRNDHWNAVIVYRLRLVLVADKSYDKQRRTRNSILFCGDSCLHSTRQEGSSQTTPRVRTLKKRFRTSATTRTQEYKAHICTITKPFSLLQTLRLDTKTKRTRRRTIDGKSQAARKTICADLKCLGCVDRWNTDERDPHQHAGALQHDRGREKVAHARSTSNAENTVIKRAARKSVTHVANGTNKPWCSQHHQIHWSPRAQPCFPNETEVCMLTGRQISFPIYAFLGINDVA